MNIILREKFVELYERPVLDELREHWRANCVGEFRVPSLPDLGKGFDIRRVLDSKYFFS